jgi:hypothetical protein
MRLVLGFIFLSVFLPAHSEEFVCNAKSQFSDSGISYSIERDGEDFLYTRALVLESGVENPGLNVTERRYKKPAYIKKSNDLPALYFIETEFYLSLNIFNVIGLSTLLIDKTNMRFESTELYGKDLEPSREHGFCFLK